MEKMIHAVNYFEFNHLDVDMVFAQKSQLR